MIRALIAALLLASASAAAQPAGETVTLAAQPKAAGGVITLGDLFAVTGETGAVAIARAPEPGNAVHIEAAWLQAFAARHGVSWANAAGLQRIRVERDAVRIETGEIERLITQELNNLAGYGDYQIELATRAALYAPAGAIGAPRIQQFDYQSRTGAFAAEIEPYAGGPVTRVTGRAHSAIEIPVLTASLAAGEIIDESDLVWTLARADRLRDDAITGMDGLVGREAKRGLRANEAIRAADVKRPAAIEKGDTVVIVYQRPGLTLTARGRALEEAALGETIRLVNLQSNRTLEAIASGAGRAEVGASAARLSYAQERTSS